MRPRVKICCISSVLEARLAISNGADALGLVSAMPSGPGVIKEEEIRAIAAQTPPGVASFLLTALTSSSEIVEQHRHCRMTTLQLVDKLVHGSYSDLRNALPGVGIVQVVHVLDQSSVREALSVAPHVDALLLDSGNPGLAVKELGGTGRVHDWALSRQIVAESRRPVFLAGGISAANVGRAWSEVRPFGFDLCSSVRTNGKLDENKLQEFFNAIRSVCDAAAPPKK
jgi:phosphoribosylanthranilate isomerase